jgi:hypothetical protein
MRILLDCHAHFYPMFSARAFFNSAYLNLARLGRADEYGVIVMRSNEALPRSEMVARVRQECPGVKIQTFPKFDIAEYGDQRLLIFHGTQVVAKEGIEVLALFHDYKPRRELSLQELVTDISACGALVVLPWSLGKWWGPRGEVLSKLLSETDSGTIFLGDICQRSAGFGTLLPLVDQYHLNGILGGSDPLPIRGDERRAGLLATGVDCEGVVDGTLTERLIEALRYANKLSVIGSKDNFPLVLYRWGRLKFERRFFRKPE